jgi:hypothetical protein
MRVDLCVGGVFLREGWSVYCDFDGGEEEIEKFFLSFILGKIMEIKSFIGLSRLAMLMKLPGIKSYYF